MHNGKPSQRPICQALGQCCGIGIHPLYLFLTERRPIRRPTFEVEVAWGKRVLAVLLAILLLAILLLAVLVLRGILERAVLLRPFLLLLRPPGVCIPHGGLLLAVL